MGRSIFIMQRNETDTEWETKTIEGKYRKIVTDGDGGISTDSLTPTAVQSSSFSGDRAIYYLKDPWNTVDLFGTPPQSTHSFYISGSDAANNCVVDIYNNSSITIQVQAGNAPFNAAKQVAGGASYRIYEFMKNYSIGDTPTTTPVFLHAERTAADAE